MSQTDEERHGFDNLVLMCGVHHKLIDAPENIAQFTAEAVAAIKVQHERQARALARPVLELTEGQLAILQAAATAYESGSTHNDFRHAVFRVGGEGGQWGGGGGGGGILTIVGTTRIPSAVSLNGQDGQAPGGGGGGAGAVQYRGRPVDTDDLAAGLRLCSVLLANAVSFSGALLNMLGSGWTYIDVPSIPANVRMWLALTFEFGDVEPSTLLRLSIKVLNPSGEVALDCPIDIEAPDNRDLVKRLSRGQFLDFKVAEHGLWAITVSSSLHILANHCFECRAP